MSSSKDSQKSDPKPILKPPKQPGTSNERKGRFKFDEQNILETFHPVGKTYGHMKIDEPDTPYERSGHFSEDEDKTIHPDELFKRLQASAEPEEMKHHKEFEAHRRKHYNEFQKVQEFLKTHSSLEDSDEDDGEDDDGNNSSAASRHATEDQEDDEHLRIAKINAERNKHLTETC